MFGLKGYIYAAALLAALSLVTYGYALQAKNAALTAENGRLVADMAVMERINALNEVARDVARAETIRFQREIKQKYQPLIEEILRSDTDEIPEHPSTVAVIERLRAGN